MKICQVFAVLVFSLSAYASEYVSDEFGRVAQAANECFDLDDAVQIDLCVEYFYTQSIEEFDSVTISIRKRLKRDIGLFDDAQNKWLAFRNSECVVQSINARSFREPETQGQLFFKACAAELNNERIRQLKKIQVDCDSCLQ